MEKRGGKREGAGRPLTVGEPLSERIMVRLTIGEVRALDLKRDANTSRAAVLRRALRAFIGLTVLLGMIGCGGAQTPNPCGNPPPNTACAVLMPSHDPPRGECPGPADDMGGIGCDPLADGCICGHELPNGEASGYCKSGVCVETSGN